MENLYTIGDVHRMTGFSVSALRYYADLKVIVPEHIDVQTGYRYYSFDDIRRLETVGYLKKAGFSLQEIAEIMKTEDASVRQEILQKRRAQAMKQMEALEERLSLMEWMTVRQPHEAHQKNYKIHQRMLSSRNVLLAEAPQACDVEQMHRYACERWRRLEVEPGRQPMGYLINENTFMEQKKLGLDGQFIVKENFTDREKAVSYMFPKGNYICMVTPVFRDERWIRALSRYFIERDIRPRNILALLVEQDFYNWKESLYEVQVLI